MQEDKKETPVENSIAYLCAVLPNDAELGKVIRQHFRKDELTKKR